jgi:hypothetical protein
VEPVEERERRGQDFYARALGYAARSDVPFLIGGAYALRHYVGGVTRATKDIDFMVKAEDYPRLLQVFSEAGLRTEITQPLWLTRACFEDLFVDVIFNTPNALCPVDDSWFEHAHSAEVLGYPVKLVPPEEIIWPKLYVMERDHFDGGDVLHVLRQQGRTLDWQRLWGRMDRHWQVLFAHLLLFRFVYPSERDAIPEWLMREMMGRAESELGETAPADKICRGMLLSSEQYLADITQWGYMDVRALAMQGRAA